MTVKLFENVILYLKSEIDTLLEGKSDTDHTHEGAGAHALGDHTDVDLSGLADGDAMVYDEAEETWKPGEAGGGGGTTVDVETRLVTATCTTNANLYNWADIPNLSVTLTCVADSKVEITFSGAPDINTANSYTLFRIVRGTTRIAGGADTYSAPNFGQSMSITATDAPGAGTFTYKVQWVTQAGRVSRISIGADWEYAIMVLKHYHS